jgi:hypothetical protein
MAILSCAIILNAVLPINAVGELGSTEYVKITSPVPNSTISLNDLLVEGMSSDDITKNCQVSLRVNNVDTLPVSPSGPAYEEDDYLEWYIDLSERYIDLPGYGALREGQNNLTV